MGPLTKEQMAKYNQLKTELTTREGNLGNQDAIKLANRWQARSNTAKEAINGLKNAKSELRAAKEILAEAKKSGNKADIEAAQALLKEVQNGLKVAKNNVGLRRVATNIGNQLSQTQTAQHLRTIKTVKSAFSKANFQSLLKSMSADGQAIINFLRNENGIANESVYQQAVDKFGYENVAKALEVFASYRLIDETV